MKFTFAEIISIITKRNIGAKRKDWNEKYIYYKNGKIYQAIYKDNTILDISGNLRLSQILEEDKFGGYDMNEIFLSEEWEIIDISNFKMEVK